MLLVSAKEAAELLKKALALPVSERADLAGSLIESLDDTQDESVAAAWDEEVARRMADIDSGRQAGFARRGSSPPLVHSGADLILRRR